MIADKATLIVFASIIGIVSLPSILAQSSAVPTPTPFATPPPNNFFVPVSTSSAAPNQELLPSGGYLLDDCQPLFDTARECAGGSLEGSPFFSDICESCKVDNMDYDGPNGILAQPSCAAIRSTVEAELLKCQAECYPTDFVCSSAVQEATVCVYTETASPPECDLTPTASPHVSYPTALPTFTGPGSECQKEQHAAYECGQASEDEDVPYGSDACLDCQVQKKLFPDMNKEKCNPDLRNFLKTEFLKCQEECYPSENECSDPQLEFVTCTVAVEYAKVCESNENGEKSTGNLKETSGSLEVYWWFTPLASMWFAATLLPVV